MVEGEGVARPEDGQASHPQGVKSFHDLRGPGVHLKQELVVAPPVKPELLLLFVKSRFGLGQLILRCLELGRRFLVLILDNLHLRLAHLHGRPTVS